MTPLIRGNLKETALLIIITWPEMGKQNIQALGGSIGFLLNVGASAGENFYAFQVTNSHQ